MTNTFNDQETPYEKQVKPQMDQPEFLAEEMFQKDRYYSVKLAKAILVLEEMTLRLEDEINTYLSNSDVS